MKLRSPNHKPHTVCHTTVLLNPLPCTLADERQSRTLLPPLAASLAYSNLQRWREETGGQTPQLVAGVDLEQLYKLGEQVSGWVGYQSTSNARWW